MPVPPRNHRSGALRRVAALACGLGLALCLAPAVPAAPPKPVPGSGRAAAPRPPLLGYRPGAELTVADCLRVSVLDLTDRGADLEEADWATVRVFNGCDEPVRHLRVDLLLLDGLGAVYGAHLWLLTRGEILWPGRSKTDRYAIRDPGGRAPRRWALRVQHVEKPSDRHRAAQDAAPAQAR